MYLVSRSTSSGLIPLALPHKHDPPWFSSAVIFVLTASATFFIWSYFSRTQSRFEAAASRTVRTGLRGGGLGLRVEKQQDALLVTWNRRAANIQSAAQGILEIDDGVRHRTVHLDSDQIAYGSVLFLTGSDDVTFQLNVGDPHGSMLTESLRVLGSGKTVKTNSVASKVQNAAPRARARTVADLNAPEPVPEVKPFPDPSEGAVLSPVPDTELRSALVARTAADTISPQLTNVTTVSSPERTTALALFPVRMSPTDKSKPPLGGKLAEAVALPESRPRLGNWEDLAMTNPPIAEPDVSTMGTYRPPRPVKRFIPNPNLLPYEAGVPLGPVEVRVNVDQTGRVTNAWTLGSADTAQPIAASAILAATQWTFKPATLHGRPVASAYTILFEPSAHSGVRRPNARSRNP
ncbi:MAG: energy transducer TonB [Bryobacteraceae bacterium]